MMPNLKYALLPAILLCFLSWPRHAFGILEICRVTVAAASEEFTLGKTGYIKALTRLANSHRRNFHRRGGARAFLFELASLFPEPTQTLAADALLAIEILDYDGENADDNVSAASRMLTAFRVLVVAWNGTQPTENHISLENLHKLAEAESALQKMGFAQELKKRDATPELDQFQDKTSGGLAELVNLAKRNDIVFATKGGVRTMLERIAKTLPEDLPDAERREIMELIAKIRDSDGGNAGRQRDAADRILAAFCALAKGFRIPQAELAHSKEGILECLRQMKADAILMPAVVLFRREGEGLAALRAFMRFYRRPFSNSWAIRDFLLEMARQLPESVRSKAVDRIAALAWKKHDGQTSRRPGGEAAAKRILDALTILAEEWNSAKENVRLQKVDATKLPTLVELRKAFIVWGWPEYLARHPTSRSLGSGLTEDGPEKKEEKTGEDEKVPDTEETLLVKLANADRFEATADAVQDLLIHFGERRASRKVIRRIKTILDRTPINESTVLSRECLLDLMIAISPPSTRETRDAVFDGLDVEFEGFRLIALDGAILLELGNDAEIVDRVQLCMTHPSSDVRKEAARALRRWGLMAPVAPTTAATPSLPDEP